MSSRRFYVVAFKACGRCEGSGRVEHPAWKALFKRQLVPTIYDMEKHFGTKKQEEWPEQMITCLNCHGTGEEQEQVELSAALEELGVLSTAEVLAR